jgi:hypothetical protein
MTFHEKTTLLINQRGKIKAAQIGFLALKVGYTTAEANEFWNELQRITGSPKAGVIWFENGFAVWQTWNDFWDYTEVPEIPEELQPYPKIRAEKQIDSVYLLFFGKAKIGKAIREIDGYFYFLPGVRIEGNSIWAAYSLRWIADCLDELNRPWDEQVKEDLE